MAPRLFQAASRPLLPTAAPRREFSAASQAPADANLGFLHEVGRFLDVGLGGAFIRNILDGNASAAASTLPIVGLFTAPQVNYAPSGRQLLDKWMGPGDWGSLSDVAPFLFGEPNSGALIEKGGFWDWTGKGVAGFALEIATDPSTYLGIGALTRSGKALKVARNGANAKRIVMLGRTQEGLANLSRAERAILPTLETMVERGLPLELGATLAEQAKAGQRALFAFDVPFTNIAEPLIRAPGTFKFAGRGGNWLRGTAFGKAFLVKPGSATGNVVFDDFMKTIALELQGSEQEILQRAANLNSEGLQLAKTLLGKDDMTRERIGEVVLGWITGAEMSDAFRALSKPEQQLTKVLRESMDEFLGRDFQSGVNISRLGDARVAELGDLQRRLIGAQGDIQQRGVAVLDNNLKSSLGRIKQHTARIDRRNRFAVEGIEQSLIRKIEKLERATDELIDLKPERISFAEGLVRGADSASNALTTSFRRAASQLQKAYKEALPRGVRTPKVQRLEAQLSTIEKQLSGSLERVNSATRRLTGVENTALRQKLRTVGRRLSERRTLIDTLDEVRKRAGVDPGDLIDAPPRGIGELTRAAQAAKVTTAGSMRLLKQENAHYQRLLALGEELVAEINPSDDLIQQVRRAIPGFVRPLRDAQNKIKNITDEITNLSKRDLRVDDYVTHLPTVHALERIEELFPARFRGAANEFTIQHASTLRRMLPGSIAEINERLRPWLNGNDFFTTDPGIILATRGIRTARAESISDLAQGVGLMRGISDPATEVFERALQEGATFRATTAQVLEGVPIEQGQKTIEAIRKVLRGDEVTEGVYQTSIRELDSLIRRHTDGKKGLPVSTDILRVWQRKNMTPKIFDAPIANEIDRMLEVIARKPAQVGKMVQWINSVTRPWKVWTLFPWPQYHARNFYSEWFLNFIAGMTNPVVALQKGWRAQSMVIADMRRRALTAAGKLDEAAKWEGRLKRMTINTTDGPMDGLRAMEEYRRLGLDEGFQRSELNMLINPVDKITQINFMAKAKGAVGKFAQDIGETAPGAFVKSTGETAARGVMALNNFVERQPRLAQWLWELEDNGRTLRDATLEVVKRHYSYNSRAFTKFENQIARTAIPFYSWIRNNTPAMFREFVKFPRRISTTARLFGKGDFSDEELQAMPEWIRDGVKVRFGQKKVIARLGLPFEDVMEWWSNPGRKALTSLHPAAQAAIELGTGRRVFSGKPIGQDTFLPKQLGARGSDLVEVLSQAAAGRFSGMGKKIADLATGDLSPAEFGTVVLSGIRARPFEPREARLQQLRGQIRRLQDEGIVSTFEVPFIRRGETRATPAQRQLVTELRKLEREASERRRRERGEIDLSRLRSRRGRRGGRRRRRRGER